MQLVDWEGTAFSRAETSICLIYGPTESRALPFFPVITQIRNYRFDVPRASFFTFRFAEPRAYSRFLSGFSVLRFFRAVRFDALRSSLLKLDVFAISPLEQS